MTNAKVMAALRQHPADVPVFYRKVGGIGDIQEVRAVTHSTYSFFGKRLPCIILEAESEEDVDG